MPNYHSKNYPLCFTENTQMQPEKANIENTEGNIEPKQNTTSTLDC